MLKQIEDIKPKMSVQTVKGLDRPTFGITTLTYNQADHIFNQAGDIYGGGDRVSDYGPTLKTPERFDVKPKISEIKNL